MSYYLHEDYIPPPLWKRILLIAPWWMNFVVWALLICWVSYAYADVCKQAAPASCVEPTTQLDMCKGEFAVTEIATKYVDLCNSKTRRFIDTLATGEQRDRFFCHCLYQQNIWSRHDP